MQQKIMSLREVQLTALNILKDIHNFCEAHKIRYTLYGGSLLGAVRHKGFIPWDDDIDIAMPRRDYERFIDTYISQNGYRLLCYKHRNSWLAFARVCDVKQTRVQNDTYPWGPEKTGVWLDVFPLDGAPDEPNVVAGVYKQLTEIHRGIQRYRVAKGNFWGRRSSISEYLYYYYSRFRVLFSKDDVFGLLAEYSKVSQEKDFEDSPCYCNYAFLNYGLKEFQSKSDFDSLVLMDFEDSKFWCIGGYQNHLNNKYGDYMTPPPESKQNGHQQSKFYWK